MSNVIPIRGVRPAPLRPGLSEHHAFALARRAALQALLAWLRTTPDPHDVAAELSAAVSALRQIAYLDGGHNAG